MKEKKINQSKQKIQSLAEQCKNKIYENKFLVQQKERFTKQINFIKDILINNSRSENNNSNINNNEQIKKTYLIEKMKELHNSLVTLNYNLKNEKKKLDNKLSSYKDNLFKDDSINKQSFTNMQFDNFLLIYQLKEKEDNINLLNKSFTSIRENMYFKEPKREISVNDKWGEYYIKVNLINLSEKLMNESQNFISFNNKCFKKEKEKNKFKKKIEYYNEVIRYLNDYLGKKVDNENKSVNQIKKNNTNKKSIKDKKIFKDKKDLTKTILITNDNELSLFDNKDDLFDENLLIDEEKKKIEKNNNLNDEKNKEKEEDEFYTSAFINEHNYENLFKKNSHEMKSNYNNNIKKKNTKTKMGFLTVDELFDINNHEGKEEAIIDDELHSDDETVFEIKIKPLKKIGIHYIPKIKMQVPRINLSQIEFNKQKVMNEADLYSLQRRKFKVQDLDENIKTMKKKIKKIRHICKTNKKKVEAFEKYSKNMENNYKALKPLKIQSSLAGVKIPKIQKFFQNDYNGKNSILNNIEDIDLGEDDSGNSDIEDIEDDLNDTESNIKRKKSISDKNNIHIKDKSANNIMKQTKIKTKENNKKIHNLNNSINRANSK